MATRAKKPTRKEKELAKQLLRAAGFDCTEQSCGKVRACQILCEPLVCETLNGRKSVASEPTPRTAGVRWCPTQLRCKPVRCGEVTCGKLVCDGQKKP